MKKTLRIGIIFLILIQMVTLGIVWAGSFYIIVYAPFCREKPIAVYVNDNDKISTLNSIWNRKIPTCYIHSGVCLVDSFSFSHYKIQIDDVIIAIRGYPKELPHFSSFLKEKATLSKIIHDLVFSSAVYKELKRLEDICITNNENDLIKKHKIFELNKDHDTEKIKTPTIIPPKATEPSKKPLPGFW